MNELINRFSSHYKIERTECEQFLSIFSKYGCAKKDNIVIPGEFNDNVYVLREGMLRAYIPTGESDISLWFAYPGGILYSIYGAIVKIMLHPSE